jgi:uncharacterized integral membrane protein (TIGR00697 family)
MRLGVDSRGDESLQQTSARVDHAEGRVARTRQRGRRLDEALEERIQGELAAERDPCVDERAEPIVLLRRHRRYSTVRPSSPPGRPRLAPVDRPATQISPLFVAIAAVFVTTLVVANIIAVKLVEISGQVFPAGLVVFPLSYLLADVLTEVYGYRAVRAVIWLGFACNVLAVAAIQIAIRLPPAGFWEERQDAYADVLGMTWRILLASLAAYLVGEFANAAVLSRLKIATRGRFLWSRTIGSTVVGQALDSAVFVTAAFAATGTPLLNPIVTTWAIKVGYEVVATPLTYLIVNTLKRRERIDAFDVGVELNPFALRRTVS